MPFCIVKELSTDVVWTTEMRFRRVCKMADREHMLECKTHSQAKTIADRRGGYVVGLDKDAPFSDKRYIGEISAGKTPFLVPYYCPAQRHKFKNLDVAGTNITLYMGKEAIKDLERLRRKLKCDNYAAVIAYALRSTLNFRRY